MRLNARIWILSASQLEPRVILKIHKYTIIDVLKIDKNFTRSFLRSSIVLSISLLVLSQDDPDEYVSF